MSIRSRHRFWRQLTGWIAVYAFVLQGIFVGLAGPHVQAASAAEICHSDPTGGATGGAPNQHDDHFDCPFCAPAASNVAPLARVWVPVVVTAAAGLIWWPVCDEPVTNPFRHSEKQSRAPPVAA